jgi:hypothetical protein
MPAEEFVPVHVFATTTKILLTLVHELTVSMQVQRIALIRLASLPVPVDYLKALDAEIRNNPEMERVREAILSMTTIEEINDILRKLEGLQ